MKLGLLSDIHGNADALAGVLEDARALGVTRLLCSGDYVGYYYDPEQCLQLLDGWDVEAVRGNHEDMLAALLEEPGLAADFRRRYGSGLDCAVRSVSGAQLAYLDALPHRKTVQIEGATILLCHGAPWDPDAYVYPDAAPEVLARCAEPGVDYVILGHTHHRFVTRVGGAMIVNPGSVGQPRDRRPGAAWAVLDTVAGECELRSLAYDINALTVRARQTDPHLPYLWDVLERT